MNETYDVVVCGTGIVECILSGLLSLKGKILIQRDSNGCMIWEIIIVNSFMFSDESNEDDFTVLILIFLIFNRHEGIASR